MGYKIAPELVTSHWFNTGTPIMLKELRGRVVLIEAFQMLCPGCVSHGLPQASRVHNMFSHDDVTVLGLHTVFEHHIAQGRPEALEAFLHEYRITFPVGIDCPSKTRSIPITMEAYQLRGTPSLVLIDREGRLRKQYFGIVEDLTLGAEIMSLLNEVDKNIDASKPANTTGGGCSDEGCPVL